MILIYAIASLLIILTIYYFVTEFLNTKEKLKNSFFTATSVIYFLPLMLQGLLLLCTGILYFLPICKSIFQFLQSVFLNTKKIDWDFLYFICFINIASIFLSINALLAKKVFDKKSGNAYITSNLIFSIFSLTLLAITYLNRNILYPFISFEDGIFFYSNPYVILFGTLAYIVILALSFTKIIKHKYFKYFKLPVLITTAYFTFCILTGIIFFVFFVLFQLLHGKLF